jgi:hypothetical protein
MASAERSIRAILLPFTTSSFEFFTRLTTQVSCDAPCSAKADFGHTTLIGGYQILDSSGSVIPGATLTSESGYDYTTPPAAAAPVGAPEPGSALLTIGIIGLLARKWLVRPSGQTCPN